jgi:hypothetical protein
MGKLARAFVPSTRLSAIRQLDKPVPLKEIETMIIDTSGLAALYPVAQT